jgi:hypothetical protein
MQGSKIERNRKTLSLYPLKFEDVISDVLKVKPEAKTGRPGKLSLETKAKLKKLFQPKKVGPLTAEQKARLKKLSK